MGAAAEGVRQAHERLLRDPTFQFRFPDATPDPLPPLKVAFHLGPGVFWVVIAVAAAVLLVVAIQALRHRGLPRVLPGATPGGDGAAAPPQVAPASAAVLADADALARAGRYGDAVHALLLRGVGAIQARFPRALLPAHTSRDIAALPVLAPASRQAFAGIAARCERAVFAQQELGREDWDACRTLYAGLLGQHGVASPAGTA